MFSRFVAILVAVVVVAVAVVDSHKMRGQGCHFSDNMKFPDFSRPRLSSNVSLRPFRGSGGMLPQKIFKNRIVNLAENEFQTTKFPDVSLTFGILSHIP